MATDVIVREALRRDDVDALAAVSMYSEAVTAEAPANLLIVTGQAEGHLRAFALGALRQVDPALGEGETAAREGVLRRAVVAPGVEHVGVLYSGTTLREVRDWLDAAFARSSDGPVTRHGPWVALLLAGLVALAWPVFALFPRRTTAEVVSWRGLTLAVGSPAVVTPLVLWPVKLSVLPVLVADYLVLHLGLFGLLQLAILWLYGLRASWTGAWKGLALLAWGALFVLVMDSYVASFVPTGLRWGIVLAMAVGAVPFMLADALVTAGGAAPLSKRLVARAGVFTSLGAAVALDFDGLFFLVLILPIILLFFLLFGSVGGWLGRRCGPAASGLPLGLLLAWSLGVSFPLFQG